VASWAREAAVAASCARAVKESCACEVEEEASYAKPAEGAVSWAKPASPPYDLEIIERKKKLDMIWWERGNRRVGPWLARVEVGLGSGGIDAGSVPEVGRVGGLECFGVCLESNIRLVIDR
jgi:hypothetical protein